MVTIEYFFLSLANLIPTSNLASMLEKTANGVLGVSRRGFFGQHSRPLVNQQLARESMDWFRGRFLGNPNIFTGKIHGFQQMFP